MLNFKGFGDKVPSTHEEEFANKYSTRNFSSSRNIFKKYIICKANQKKKIRKKLKMKL